MPDLFIKRPGHPPIVVDTKWKHLDAATRPSSADAYQMLAYAHAYGTRDCVLLYPSAARHNGPGAIASTHGGRELLSAHGPFRWRLHRTHVSLRDYATVDAQLRGLIADLLHADGAPR